MATRRKPITANAPSAAPNAFSLVLSGFNEGQAPAAHLDSLTEIGTGGQYSAAANVDIISSPGLLTQGPGLSTLTNGTEAGAVTELINHIIDKPVQPGITYGISTTKLHQIQASSVTNAGIWPHAITGAILGSSVHYMNGVLYYFYNTASFNVTTNMVASTDVLTISSPTTLALAGITNATPLIYNSVTHGGLTQGTTYYVGSIVGNTFKLYNDVGLSSLVDITADTTGATFQAAATGGDCGKWNGITGFTDAYFSVTPTGASSLQNAPHPVASKQDIMVFGNGRYAGVFNTTTTTLAATKLDFGQDAQVADVCFNANQWLIAVNQGTASSGDRQSSSIFLYDASATTSLLTDEIGVGVQKIGFLLPIEGVTYVAYQDVSSVGGFCIGYISGRSIKPLRYFTGTLPTFAQKSLYGNTIIFLSNGLVYSCGAVIESLPIQLSQMASGGFTTTGALAAPFGTPMVASMQSTSFKLAKFANYDTACNWRSIVIPLLAGNMIGFIDRIIVSTNTLGSGARCDLIVESNQASANGSTQQITTSGKRRHSFNSLGLVGIEDFRLFLNWANGSTSNPVKIRKITVQGHYIERS